MGIRLVSFHLLLVLLPCACRRVPETPKAVAVREDGVLALRLMSFNVRYENPGDRDSRAWRRRVVGSVKMIRREKPEIIGVQEALHGQVADLRISLPEYGFHGIGRGDGRRAGEYSGIFYQQHRFKPDPSDQGTFWLSDTPELPGSRTWGNEIPRVAAWIRLVDLTTGRGFYVFNTHWDHRHQRSRELSALLIARRIDARKRADEPVVLLGDFNSMENNPGLLYLTGRRTSLVGSGEIWSNGLVDTYQTLHSGEKNRRTLHFWSGRRDGLKVDHILVSRGARIEESEIVSRDVPEVSDHFPVTARVSFPKPE
jgi:endonuclease/exonuclease/phosphatase family metal-dependent hydrolase